jgi:plasmid stabilization system protein ParE
MANIRWTPQAADDLESIADFIGLDSPHYASLFVLDVIGAVERLGRFPQLGRVVPEMQDSTIRELLLGNYRIIYRAQEDVVEILTVYHGARMLDPRQLK